jgi:hypothetical protein
MDLDRQVEELLVADARRLVDRCQRHGLAGGDHDRHRAVLRAEHDVVHAAERQPREVTPGQNEGAGRAARPDERPHAIDAAGDDVCARLLRHAATSPAPSEASTA